MEKKVHVALLGLGTVGLGVYKVLKQQESEMMSKLGCEIEISHILVRNLEKAAAKIEDASILTNDFNTIINDPEVDIVVEVMGGIEPAKTYIEAALSHDIHVVTANKDLMAEYGHELLALAGAHKCDLLYEASVAGGIPIIRPLKQCLLANDIDELMGIINGTTNFILTKMTQEGMEFDEALALATELGYAEADPTADIEGLDAGRKIAIIASIAFHSNIKFSEISAEGITKITATDISYAAKMGYVIKLLGIARNTEDGIEAGVYPMLLKKNHPLASVNDSFNAVFVHGNSVGDTMFYGRGAGELPTASAVCGDVFDIAKDMRFDCCSRLGSTCYKKLSLKDKREICSRYYLRLKAQDGYGILADVTSIFCHNMVSIEQINAIRNEDNTCEIVITTGSVKAKHMTRALETLGDLEFIKDIASVIRVYS